MLLFFLRFSKILLTVLIWHLHESSYLLWLVGMFIIKLQCLLPFSSPIPVFLIVLGWLYYSTTMPLVRRGNRWWSGSPRPWVRQQRHSHPLIISVHGKWGTAMASDGSRAPWFLVAITMTRHGSQGTHTWEQTSNHSLGTGLLQRWWHRVWSDYLISVIILRTASWIIRFGWVCIIGSLCWWSLKFAVP